MKGVRQDAQTRSRCRVLPSASRATQRAIAHSEPLDCADGSPRAHSHALGLVALSSGQQADLRNGWTCEAVLLGADKQAAG